MGRAPRIRRAATHAYFNLYAPAKAESLTQTVCHMCLHAMAAYHPDTPGSVTPIAFPRIILCIPRRHTPWPHCRRSWETEALPVLRRRRLCSSSMLVLACFLKECVLKRRAPGSPAQPLSPLVIFPDDEIQCVSLPSRALVQHVDRLP